MTVIEAISQLRGWCDSSNGLPITIAPGITTTFQTKGIIESDEFQMIEDRLDFVPPESYRLLMSTVGQSLLFSNSKYGGGFRLFHPNEVVDASEHIWDGEGEAGSDRFCLVGEHRSMGDYIGFVINRPGPKNFDVFCHEYPPGEYASISDEMKSWRTFEGWLIRTVESFGKDTL